MMSMKLPAGTMTDAEIIERIKLDNRKNAKFERHKEATRFRARGYQREIRKKVISLMGGKCVRCDFDDERALQIDHVNGGGVKDKTSIGGIYHKRVAESYLADEGKYQLLCANCNWIKRAENREVSGRGD